MPKEEKKYTVVFTEHELETLRECLQHLRKRIDRDYEESHMSQQAIEPMQNPVFIGACEMQFKIAKALNPDTTVTFLDFVNFGNYGRSN